MKVLLNRNWVMINQNILKFIFIPGRLNQWNKFEYKKLIIWIAGINKKEKFIKIKNLLFNEFDKLDKKKDI